MDAETCRILRNKYRNVNQCIELVYYTQSDNKSEGKVNVGKCCKEARDVSSSTRNVPAGLLLFSYILLQTSFNIILTYWVRSQPRGLVVRVSDYRS
jgi:hypothetical protein